MHAAVTPTSVLPAPKLQMNEKNDDSYADVGKNYSRVFTSFDTLSATLKSHYN